MAEQQRGQAFLAGLPNVRYSLMEAAKVVPEAWPLPGLLVSVQELGSQLA